MCGIAGVVGCVSPGGDTVPLVTRMTRLQAHRGPDGEGIWSSDHAVLGHRRLAIIDVSENGRQPMTNEDGSLVIVVNGEIYSYKSLRAQLARRGHVFKSHSDSETILHLYEEVGDRCVEQLVGMFAFALWDVRARRLLLARDRIGEKPLYYAFVNGGIAFASEIKALLTVPGVDTSLDREAVTATLVYSSAPPPLTFFKGIRALEPAAVMAWHNGAATTRRYWSLNFARASRRWTWDSALERYDALLTESVSNCLVSDVPVGVYLSGGVDSSSICAKAAELVGSVPTFCIGHSTEERPDPELLRAVRVADILNLPHTSLNFNLLDVTRLPYALSYYDQPFYQLRLLLDDQLAAAARRSVKVVLTGAGADEIFGGYRGYNNVRLASLFDSAAGLIPQALIRALPGDDAAKWKTFAQVARLPLEKRKGAMLEREKDVRAHRLFTPEWYKFSSQCSVGRFADYYCSECEPRNYLDATLYFQLMSFNQHGTTMLSDVAGMSKGLEIRSPFLNHALIEFAASLPIDFLVPSLANPKHNKAIVKKHLALSMPDDIVYARKFGFGYALTYRDLLSRSWRPAAEAFVAKGRYLDLGIFSPEAARAAVDEGSYTAFMLLVFSVWAEMYVFGDPADRVSDALARAMRN
jgi:asparagine synthase (glutamine-hydrolysing)